MPLLPPLSHRPLLSSGIGDQALFVRVFWQSSQMKHVTLPVRRLLDSCRNLLTVATNEHPYEVQGGREHGRVGRCEGGRVGGCEYGGGGGK